MRAVSLLGLNGLVSRPEHAFFPFGGQYDHRKRAGRRPRAQLAQQLETGPIGEVEIQEHCIERGRPLAERRARIGERAGETHGTPKPLEMRA